MYLLKNRTKVLFWSLISFVITVAAGGSVIAVAELTKSCPVESEKRVWGNCYRDLQAKPLTIGVASGAPDEDYNVLAKHLQAQLGSPVEVERGTPYRELSSRIVRKDWDVAFTRSPIFSITAEDNGYTGVAPMFPEEGPYYRAALYVRSDSSIKSLAGIKPTTTIALGSPESAPTFHLPIYTLYGKSLRVGKGYSPRKVVQMVKAGIVDVGSGRLTSVKNDPALRMIHVSKAIPGAGVYLSPSLSDNDRERIQEALLTAPAEIKASARYGDGQIPKYDELRKILLRTEEILGCPGFSVDSLSLQQTVKLFCSQTLNTTDGIQGQVEEYSVSTSRSVQFKLVTEQNQVYLVLVPKQILDQRSIEPVDLVDQSVKIINVKPQRLADGTWRVRITQAEQLSIR